MKTYLRFLIPLLALCFVAGAKKNPPVTVRFHVEANRLDGDRFSQPVQLKYPPRAAFIERVPSISERQIKSMYPYQAEDGSWGCAFQLDNSGRLGLEVLSTERRGSSLVAFVGTKTGTHQVIDLQVDRPITDGIITIPRGLTELEIQALKKSFPPMPQLKKQQS